MADPSRKIWDWLNEKDPAKIARATNAVWQMEKMNLAELERAAGTSAWDAFQFPRGFWCSRLSHRLDLPEEK